MKNIIFIAPPAAGKGTISDYLKKKYNYSHLSTGDLLREEIKKGTSLGKELDALIQSGKLVSDELIIRLVEEELNKINDKPFILDGFPRTLEQAYQLDKILDKLNVSNNVVIYLDTPLDVATKRVLGRVICPVCKRSYNIYNEALKPLNNNLCDDCQVELEHRSDDNEETFKVRFQTFVDSTKPILDYYQDKNLLVNVDATLDIDDIYKSVTNVAL